MLRSKPLRRQRVMAALALTIALAAFPLASLASDAFGDVPDSNTFHDDINAIYHKGVTTGCSQVPLLYCPADFVSREQMAAFMNRLGALGVGQVPVVNADRLDGLHANWLVRVAEDIESLQSAALTGIAMTYGSLQITAPTDGFVLVTAGVTLRELACTMGCLATASLRHVYTGGSASSTLTIEWVDERSSLALTSIFAVAPGTNTFETRLLRSAGDGNMNGVFNNMTALFVPFGASGLPPET